MNHQGLNPVLSSTYRQQQAAVLSLMNPKEMYSQQHHDVSEHHFKTTHIPTYLLRLTFSGAASAWQPLTCDPAGSASSACPHPPPCGRRHGCPPEPGPAPCGRPGCHLDGKQEVE